MLKKCIFLFYKAIIKLENLSKKGIFKMNEKKKNNIGFYIALCCCVGIIGIVGYFADREENQIASVNSTQKPIVTIKPTPSPSEKIKEQTPLPTLSPTVSEKTEIETASLIEEELVLDEDVDVLEKGEPEEFYDGETVESVFLNSDPSFILPTEGEICEKFSDENLVYNKAMGDWRTHNGIDIKANAGEDVLVSSDGIIEEIYTDYLGNTVIIDHKNGFKTKYSNLDTTESLTIGVKVKQGEFLAKVGDYSFGENTEEPHLHFEIIKNDRFVDPEDYIG